MVYHITTPHATQSLPRRPETDCPTTAFTGPANPASAPRQTPHTPRARRTVPKPGAYQPVPVDAVQHPRTTIEDSDQRALVTHPPMAGKPSNSPPPLNVSTVAAAPHPGSKSPRSSPAHTHGRPPTTQAKATRQASQATAPTPNNVSGNNTQILDLTRLTYCPALPFAFGLRPALGAEHELQRVQRPDTPEDLPQVVGRGRCAHTVHQCRTGRARPRPHPRTHLAGRRFARPAGESHENCRLTIHLQSDVRFCSRP
jgi:hypothetical protein